MANIFYYTNTKGEEMGLWPGISVRTEKGSRKTGQIRLGKVIDKEKSIFFNQKYGYYHFDPADQSCYDIPLSKLPDCLTEMDQRRRRTPVIVRFGGSYFLYRLLTDIEYLPVIDCIDYENPDRLHSMFLYYSLCNRANRYAENWYMHSFAKYLYPKANLVHQRISEFLSAIGTPENVREFLNHHIEYVLDATDQEKCVLIDSTGCPNKCSLYVTRVSVHEGQVNVEFRVIVVVQKSTGLPLYYKIIPGNVVDIRTVEYVIRIMKNLGCEVEYVIGDAGYCCPSIMERMIWAGVEFMTRLCPHFNLFKNLAKSHLVELERPENLTDYHGRKVYILKLKEVIAHEKETGNPVEGNVYLCRDIQAQHSKIDHLMNSKKFSSMTNEEFLAACEKLGLFAIVTTRDLPADEVLPEYYIRQAIEQFFDFAKNFGCFLPVRCQSMETLSGHMLLAFAVTFIVCLIEYRLNHVNTHYLVVRKAMQDAAITLLDGSATFIETEDGTEELTIEQDILMDIYRESAGELFETLEYQMADVFDEEIVPEPIVEVNSLYNAYGLHSPYYVQRKDGNVTPVMREGDIDECSKILAFARKPTMTDEEIKRKRSEAKQKKLEKAAAKQGFKLSTEENQDGDSTTQTATADPAAPTSHPDNQPDGHKEGGENKALEQECVEAEATGREAEDVDIGTPTVTKETEEAKPKRGRGRPPGSKNKKTLERERMEAEAAAKAAEDGSINTPTGTNEADAAKQKRGRGRPPGSKNKKTLERERMAAEKAEETKVEEVESSGNRETSTSG